METRVIVRRTWWRSYLVLQKLVDIPGPYSLRDWGRKWVDCEVEDLTSVVLSLYCNKEKVND